MVRRAPAPGDSKGFRVLLSCAGRKLLETSDTVGTFARPAQPIILYEFEGCPFCRKVGKWKHNFKGFRV